MFFAELLCILKSAICGLLYILRSIIKVFNIFPGRPVLILNGRWRGHQGTLLSLDEKAFSVSVEIKEVFSLYRKDV